MKKLIALLLAVVMVLGLVACGGNKAEETTPAADTTEAAANNDATEAADEMTDADGSEFYKNAGSSDEYDGYYDVSAEAYEDNYAKAYEILTKYYEVDSNGMLVNFPTLTYLYNTSEGHEAIGEYLQSALAGVGITMNLENQEWNTFLNTRKNGDYSVARNGWLADYNDPICFLDMWTTASGNNDVQFGKGDHATVAEY